MNTTASSDIKANEILIIFVFPENDPINIFDKHSSAWDQGHSAGVANENLLK